MTVCVNIDCISYCFFFPSPVVIASSAQLSSQGVYPPSSAQEDELAAEVCVVQLQSIDLTFESKRCITFHHCTGFVRVLENLESPGILFWHFPGLSSPRKKSHWSWKVLESVELH